MRMTSATAAPSNALRQPRVVPAATTRVRASTASTVHAPKTARARMTVDVMGLLPSHRARIGRGGSNRLLRKCERQQRRLAVLDGGGVDETVRLVVGDPACPTARRDVAEVLARRPV